MYRPHIWRVVNLFVDQKDSKIIKDIFIKILFGEGGGSNQEIDFQTFLTNLSFPYLDPK